MRAAFVAVIAGPVLAGGAVMAFAEAPRTARRWLGVLGCVAGLAGIAFVGGTALAEGSASVASFMARPWEAMLAAGILLAALFIPADDPFEQVCHLCAAGAGAGFVLASDVVSASAFLLATTVAAGLGARRGSGRGWLHAAAASDVLALAALLWAASSGMRVPPSPSDGQALLLMAAGITRLASSRGGAGWVLRAQGVVLCAWALTSSPDWAPAIATVLALAAAKLAHRAWVASDVSAVTAAEALGVVALLAIGDPSARAAAALLTAGALLAWAKTTTGSAVALIALLPGMAAGAAAVLDGGQDLLGMVQGLALTSAFAWIGLARATGRAAPWSFTEPAVLLPALALALLPGTAYEALMEHVAPALGGGPALAPSVPALPDGAGAAFAVAAFGVSVVLRPWNAARVRAHASQPLAAGFGAPRSAAAIEVVALALFVPLLVTGMQRGFL